MNEVEEYLFNNKGKKLGLNRIYRDLPLKKRNIFLYQNLFLYFLNANH